MVGICDSLKKPDLAAFRLCEARVAEGDGLKELDQGAQGLEYRDLKKGPQRVVSEAAQNDSTSSQEVYQRLLDVVESEEDSRVRAYAKNLKKTPAFSSTWLQILRDKGEVQVPFIFDDLDATTNSDEKLFKLCIAKVQELEKVLAKKKLKAGSAEYQEAMARALFDFITASPKSGGLGIQFENSADRPTRAIGEVYAQGKATCLEFVYLFSALGRMAKSTVVPVEVFRNQDGLVIQHVRMALMTGEGSKTKTIFFDISDQEPPGERKDEAWLPLSQLELLAYYYNSQAITAPIANMGKIYEKALSFAPRQYMVLTNFAEWLRFEGQAKQALPVLEKAKQSNEFYPYLFASLAKVYEELGEKTKAKEAKTRAEKLFKPI